MILFAAGWLGGARSEAPAVRPAGERFLFLIYGETSDTANVDSRVAEYGAWAVETRRGGRHVSGERLVEEVAVLGSGSGDPAPSLGGFFIVGAESLDAARRLAATHPHVRYGGTIVVRKIACRN